MLRPLPPFRAKPSRKPLQPKLPGESRKKRAPITVKARRHPVKVARLATARALKVLGETHA